MSSPHGNLFWDANLNIITQKILTNSSCSTPNCSVSNKKRNVKVGREHDIHILHPKFYVYLLTASFTCAHPLPPPRTSSSSSTPRVSGPL